MPSKFPRPAISELTHFAVCLMVSLLWQACAKPKPARKQSPVVANAAAASSSATVVMGRDVCEHAAEPCACAAEQGAKLLVASFPERALQVVTRAPGSCTSPALLGPRAEALAAVERGPEATALATSVLAKNAEDRFAQRALAIVAIQKHELAAADTILSKLVREDEKDSDSLFYLALIQRKGEHYNGAREGFLHVLRVNPQHVDARYNLVTLTASAGASQEAEHHYEELLQIAPVGDPRLISARTALHKDAPAGPVELPILHQAPHPSAGPNGPKPNTAPVPPSR